MGLFYFMDTEIWKDVVNYEGLYQVSNLGNVKSMDRQVKMPKGGVRYDKGKTLNKTTNSDGYFRINLCKEGKGECRNIHQLVAESFLNHKRCGLELVVNHINHIRTDNRVENLEVVTMRGNANHKKNKYTSEYNGVSWDTVRGKWIAKIHIGRKNKYLGAFDNEIEASDIYNKALKSIENKEEIFVKKHKYSSNYKGVSWNKATKKWDSAIKIDGKKIHIGNFVCEIEAHKYYEKAVASTNKGLDIELNRKPKTNKYVGVYFRESRNKFLANISVNGKLKHLGYFTNEIDAYNARKEAEVLYG